MIYLRRIILPVIFMIAFTSLNAQNYERAIGVRGGVTRGFTYKQFKNVDEAYEGILSFRKGGTQVTLLKEITKPASIIRMSDEFYFAIGYGGHVGFNYTDEYMVLYRTVRYSTDKFMPVVGVDGYFGLEYRIYDWPIIIGVDYKPFMEMSIPGFFSMHLGDVSIALRVVF